MPASTSLVLEGYILDTNVLSLHVKEGHLNLLQTVRLPLYITPAIQIELEAGVQRGGVHLTLLGF